MNDSPATNQAPLVSIVTITYNAAEVLTPTMESLATQTFTDFEHLIIDGASNDATLEIASELRTAATRILSEKDNGLYDAMNKGLHLARGKYIIFINAGDSFADPDSLKHIAESIDENTDIIYGDTVIVNSERDIIGPRHLSVPERLTFDSFAKGMLICHQAFMVRKELAPDYDLSYRFSADYDWTIKCIRATSPERCRNVHKVIIHYLSDGLTDKNKIPSLKERYRIMAHHYGKATAFFRHIGFVPRAITRKLGLKK